MKQVLTATQKCTVALKISDAAGNPAKVDGAPTWVSNNSDVITVTPAEDGMSAELITTGALGELSVTVTADADTGEGMKPIIGVLDVEVVPGEARVVELVPGTPTEKE